MNVVALQWRIQDFPCCGVGVPFGIIFAQNGMEMKKWTKSATAFPRNFLELDIIKSLVSLTADKMTIQERNIQKFKLF